MPRIFAVFLSLLCLSSVSSQNYHRVCKTEDGVRGFCVDENICNAHRNMKMGSAAGNLIKQTNPYCRSMRKVCCPTITTVNKRAIFTVSSTIATVPVKTPGEDFPTSFPEPPVCGVSKVTISRVVGGVNAVVGQFPWMAVLGYMVKNAVTWDCGGSLITSRHVLTAAHCIRNYVTTLKVVRLGELDLTRKDDGAVPVDVLIEDMIQHENYTNNSFNDDIGVLILARNVQFTDQIRPICMPMSTKLKTLTYEGNNPFVAGWGTTQYMGIPSNHLQALQLPVVGNGICAYAYRQYTDVLDIDHRVICAGGEQGKGDCKGDSGGPLMQPIYDAEKLASYYYQIGVNSVAFHCGLGGVPGVYVRVPYFMPWIEKTVFGKTQF